MNSKGSRYIDPKYYGKKVNNCMNGIKGLDKIMIKEEEETDNEN